MGRFKWQAKSHPRPALHGAHPWVYCQGLPSPSGAAARMWVRREAFPILLVARLLFRAMAPLRYVVRAHRVPGLCRCCG